MCAKYIESSFLTLSMSLIYYLYLYWAYVIIVCCIVHIYRIWIVWFQYTNTSMTSYDHLHTLFKSHLKSKLNKHKNNLSTYYGKTDFTFLMSSDSWTCFGTPSFNLNFMSFEPTPGIAPKCRTKRKNFMVNITIKRDYMRSTVTFTSSTNVETLCNFEISTNHQHVCLKDQEALVSHVKTS